MQVTLHALEVVNAGDYSSQRNSGTIPQSFRPFGEVRIGSVPLALVSLSFSYAARVDTSRFTRHHRIA